ncbi:MAG: nucleotidyltransferase family protein [Thermodesulfobacteriota bacterium]
MHSITLWEEINKTRKRAEEKQRIKILEKTGKALNKLSREFHFQEAWIFGSLTREGGWRSHSDIDIALQDLDKFELYSFVAAIQEITDLSVDVVRLEESPLAPKIKREGILWTPREK